MEWDLTTRSKQIEYAHANGIQMPVFKTSPYSRDANLWGTSVECGEIDNIESLPPEDAYTITRKPNDSTSEPETVSIEFMAARPVRLNEKALPPVELVTDLNEIGGRHGIGRLDIIENRVVGFKVRGVYESPAAEILSAAMSELENLVLDRDLLHTKPLLSQQYADLIYEGKWFSGKREALDGFFDGYAQRVNGTIILQLDRGRIIVAARRSPNSLYNLGISSYESYEGFDQTAGVGFSYIWSMQGRVAALQRSSEQASIEPAAETREAS